MLSFNLKCNKMSNTMKVCKLFHYILTKVLLHHYILRWSGRQSLRTNDNDWWRGLAAVAHWSWSMKLLHTKPSWYWDGWHPVGIPPWYLSQPSRPTQPPIPVGMENEYQPNGGNALWLGSEGRCGFVDSCEWQVKYDSSLKHAIPERFRDEFRTQYNVLYDNLFTYLINY